MKHIPSQLCLRPSYLGKDLNKTSFVAKTPKLILDNDEKSCVVDDNDVLAKQKELYATATTTITTPQNDVILRSATSKEALGFTDLTDINCNDIKSRFYIYTGDDSLGAEAKWILKNNGQGFYTIENAAVGEKCGSKKYLARFVKNGNIGVATNECSTTTSCALWSLVISTEKDTYYLKSKDVERYLQLRDGQVHTTTTQSSATKFKLENFQHTLT
jgi:hypothetical protein